VKHLLKINRDLLFEKLVGSSSEFGEMSLITYHHEKKSVLASTECSLRMGPRRDWMAAMGASKAKQVPITSKEIVGGIFMYKMCVYVFNIVRNWRRTSKLLHHSRWSSRPRIAE
jgi:hypothetical protein